MNRAFSSPPSPNGRPTNQDPIASYLDQLNALWKKAEDELAAMHVSIPIEIEIKAGYGAYSDQADEPDWHETVYLGWRNMGKEWRLCVGVVREYMGDDKARSEWKPIAESPKEFRIELAEHYPKLKTKVKDEREKLIPRTAAAIASLKQALGD
jgi:hypothetical protein